MRGAALPALTWLPPQASTVAAEVDRVLYVVLGISAFFLLLVTVLGAIFVWRYRERRQPQPGAAPSGNLPLEIAWTVVPLLLVVWIFWVGFEVFVDMATPPRDAYEILVTGQKWTWLFTYPNGYVDQNLHVPADRTVRLVMSSEDVIHSFFVPDFRVKQDVIPGRYTKLWFVAPQPGEHQVFCAEYCGTSHSDMLAKVVVHRPEDFDAWLREASDFLNRMGPAEAGALLFRTRGCAQCHSVDGTPGTGPSLAGIFGHAQRLADGTTVVADEDYLRESLLEPTAKVVAGYEPVMPTYRGRLNDREITALVEYLKTLGGSR